MTFWIVSAAVAVIVLALVWWWEGRSATRRRGSIDTEVAIRRGQDEIRNTATGNGGGFSIGGTGGF